MKFKKIAAAFLSAALAFTSFSFLEKLPDVQLTDSIIAEAAIIDSGQCGLDAKWEIDSNGKLTIYGSGEITQTLNGVSY